MIDYNIPSLSPWIVFGWLIFSMFVSWEKEVFKGASRVAKVLGVRPSVFKRFVNERNSLDQPESTGPNLYPRKHGVGVSTVRSTDRLCI